MLIGAASVLTFGATFYLTTEILPHSRRGVRVALAITLAVTFCVGYGLFVLADRLGLRKSPDTPSGTLFK